MLEATRAHLELYDVPASDLDVTTHPLGVDEVAAEIVRRLGSWRRRPRTPKSPPPSPTSNR